MMYLTLRYQFLKHRDRMFRKLAWRLPKRLVMWCYFRVLAYATMGEYGNTNPNDLNVFQAIDRWPSENHL